MPQKGDKKKHQNRRAAIARLNRVADRAGIDADVVKVVVEGQVPQDVSTSTLSSAYKIAETSEAAHKLVELTSSSKANSSSSKKEIRQSIVGIKERVESNLNWANLNDRWEVLQNKGSSEYGNEV